MLLPTKKPDMFESDQLRRQITVFYDNELRVLTPDATLPPDYWQNFCRSVRRGQKGVYLRIELRDRVSGLPPLANAYEVPHIDAEYFADERLAEIRLEYLSASTLCDNGRPVTLHMNTTLTLGLHLPNPSDPHTSHKRQLSIPKGVRLTIATGEMQVTI